MQISCSQRKDQASDSTDVIQKRVSLQSWLEQKVTQGTSDLIFLHFLLYLTMQQVSCFWFLFLTGILSSFCAMFLLLMQDWVWLMLVLIPLFQHQLNNQWKIVNKFFLLCFYRQLGFLFLFFFKLCCLFLSQWAFSSYFLFLPVEEGEWESSWVEAWQPAKINPPTHAVVFRFSECPLNYERGWNSSGFITKAF